MSNELVRKYQFIAAMSIILVLIGYIFLCAFIKPIIDLTTPILSLITLLVGYYWGSSKSSQERSDMQTKKDSGQDATIQQAASDLTATITKGA